MLDAEQGSSDDVHEGYAPAQPLAALYLDPAPTFGIDPAILEDPPNLGDSNETTSP